MKTILGIFILLLASSFIWSDSIVANRFFGYKSGLKDRKVKSITYTTCDGMGYVLFDLTEVNIVGELKAGNTLHFVLKGTGKKTAKISYASYVVKVGIITLSSETVDVDLNVSAGSAINYDQGVLEPIDPVSGTYTATIKFLDEYTILQQWVFITVKIA